MSQCKEIVFVLSYYHRTVEVFSGLSKLFKRLEVQTTLLV